MIVFDLACDCGCQFEGWFGGRADFEQQLEAGQLICPACGSSEVRKILSPVAVRTGGPAQRASDSGREGVPGERFGEYFLRILGDYVRENFEDVGAKFAEEALKMHYGVKEARDIRGVTTPGEDEMLDKEGIKVVKVPLITDKDKGKKEN